MGFFWTTALEDAVDGAFLEVADGPVDVKVHLMARAPHLDEDVPLSYRSTGLLSTLTSLAGWEEVSDPGYSPVTVSADIVNDGNNFFISPTTQSISFAMDRRNQVEAIVYTMSSADLTGSGVGDYVVFATGTLFSQRVILNDGDGIYALDDNTATVPWLFGWAQSLGVFATAAEGPIALRQGAPEFESSRLQHLWMRPQRVNYIANPSFEYSGGFWQSNLGPLTRVATSEGGATTYAGTATFYTTPTEVPVGTVHAGVATASGEAMSLITSGLTSPGPSTALLNAQVTAYDASVLTSTEVLPQYAPDNRIYLRSAAFYPIGPNLTFQVKARGVGTARVGIVYYTRDYSEQTGDWGLKEDQFFQEWVLATDHDIDMQGIRILTDRAYEASLVIEVRGYMDNYEDPDTWVWIAPEITIDQVLVEEGTLLGWPYFDGDSTYGADGDFSWYGPDDADKVGKSYSLWYNDRKNIAGRLFARRVDDTALYTSYDEVQDSLLTEWVPAGTTIVPHWGVLGPDDPQFLPVDQSADTLPLEVWPEQVQPFEVFEVLSITEDVNQVQTAHVLLSGLGPHPITRAFTRTLPGGIITPVTVTKGYTNDPDIVADHNEAVAKYDFTNLTEYVFSWPRVGSLNATTTLYLERGDSWSPQSYLAYELLSSASAGFTEGLAEALDASVEVALSSEAVAATGAAANATGAVSPGAEQIAASATALTAGASSSSESVVLAAATGAAFNAEILNGVLITSGTAEATGAANDNGASVSFLSEASAAVGSAETASVVPGLPAGQIAAAGVANDGTTTISFTSEASAATASAETAAAEVDPAAGLAAGTGAALDSTESITIEGATVGIGSGTANNAEPDLVSVPTSLSTSGITTSAITLNWSAPATFNNPAHYEMFKNGVSQGTDAASPYTFSGLAGDTSYTLGVRAVSTTGAVSNLATISATTLNPDSSAPVQVITSWKPESTYGNMVVRWTNSADTQTYLDTVEIQYGTTTAGNETTQPASWTSEVTYTADDAFTLAGGSNARTVVTGTSGQTMWVRIRATDKAGNVGAWVTSAYLLIDAQVFVAATGTSSWRNSNGGEWNAANDSRAYQGYFSDPAWNYRGFYFYSNGISAYYKSGRRTCTSMRQLLIRAGSSGSSSGHTPIMALHKTVSRPADATGVASPSLFGSQTSTGLSLGFNGSGYWTLPASWRDGLLDGTYEGLLHYDSTSPVYAAYCSTADNGFTGLIEINTLG